MDRGYIKFWRKSIDSDVFHDPNLWRLWTWCLMKTNREQKMVPFLTGKGRIIVKVDAGQFIFGRNRAAEALCEPASSVWKRMKKLEKLGNISIDSNNQYSIVSICNWDIYQSHENKKEQASDKQGTSKEQASDTNKNHKNEKNEDRGRQHNGLYEQIISYLNERCGKNFKPHGEETIGLINGRVRDGYSLDDFKRVIDAKSSEWKGDEKMDRYLRPKTLFAKTKFEDYLNQSPAEPEYFNPFAGVSQ